MMHSTLTGRTDIRRRHGGALSAFACFSTVLLLVCNSVSASAYCASSTQDAAAVVEALKGWFAALRSGDVENASRLTAPAFYAYDAGRRFTGAEFTRAIEQARAKGQHFEWNLSAFDTHVSCDQAWVAYTNTGGVRTSQGFTPLTWLESAAFEHSAEGWRLRFLHSSALER